MDSYKVGRFFETQCIKSPKCLVVGPKFIAINISVINVSATPFCSLVHRLIFKKLQIRFV